MGEAILETARVTVKRVVQGPWTAEVINDTSAHKIHELGATVAQIRKLENPFGRLSDQELKTTFQELSERAREESLDAVLPKAFALMSVSIERNVGLSLRDIQLIAGCLIHDGKIAEIKTGEGKTLVALAPAALNTLEGKSVHVVTINEYLARYAVQWMGPAYHGLGLRVGVVQGVDQAFIYDPQHRSDDPHYDHLRPVSRQEAYQADVTYGSFDVFGHDVLRNQQVMDAQESLDQKFDYVIVDEADSILIDEAQTPLVIALDLPTQPEPYLKFAGLAASLFEGIDYELDQTSHSLIITDHGYDLVERRLDVGNLHQPENGLLVNHLRRALEAKALYQQDRDYVVVGGRISQIVFVDQISGYPHPEKRFQDGLQQALEAKHRLQISPETIPLGLIPIQTFFKMYRKIAGMTGTASEEAEEFWQVYSNEVVVVPTHLECSYHQGKLTRRQRPLSEIPVAFAGVDLPRDATVTVFQDLSSSKLQYHRLDLPDLMFPTEPAKHRAMISEIIRVHETGRPILVGTTSVGESEVISALLKKAGVTHQVLNAKNPDQDADIIAQAGRLNAVTISTQMAGRGVNIPLGGNPEILAKTSLVETTGSLRTITPGQWETTLNRSRRLCAQEKEQVTALGGLHIIAAAHHFSPRVDHQLQGRIRPGSPGTTRTFDSLESDLLQSFSNQELRGLVETNLITAHQGPIPRNTTRLVSDSQKRYGSLSRDLRRRLLDFESVFGAQREHLYAERHRVLTTKDLTPTLMAIVEKELMAIFERFNSVGENGVGRDVNWLVNQVNGIFSVPATTKVPITVRVEDELVRRNAKGQLKLLMDFARQAIRQREATLGIQAIRERVVNIIDSHWINYLIAIEEARQGYWLRAYGGQNPLIEFARESPRIFRGLLDQIGQDMVTSVFENPSAAN